MSKGERGNTSLPPELRKDPPSVDSEIRGLEGRLKRLDKSDVEISERATKKGGWWQATLDSESNDKKRTKIAGALEILSAGTHPDLGSDVASDNNFLEEMIEKVDKESVVYVLDKIMETRLNEREQQCLKAIFFDGKEEKEIAKTFGVDGSSITTARVNQIKKSAISKIKKFFEVVKDAMHGDPDWDYRKYMTLKQEEDPHSDFFRSKKTPQIQQLVDFVREHEDRFFRKTE